MRATMKFTGRSLCSSFRERDGVEDGSSCKNAQEGFLIRSTMSPRKFTGRKFISPVNSARNWLFRPVDTLTPSSVSPNTVNPRLDNASGCRINDHSSTPLIHAADFLRALTLVRKIYCTQAIVWKREKRVILQFELLWGRVIQNCYVIEPKLCN